MISWHALVRISGHFDVMVRTCDQEIVCMIPDCFSSYNDSGLFVQHFCLATVNYDSIALYNYMFNFNLI